MIEKRIVDPKKLASISNCTGESVIIGMVSKRDGELWIEDGTGSVKLITNAKDILEDDVIAAEGRGSDKLFFAEKIIYPDVPLRPVIYSKYDVTLSFNGDSDFIVTDSYILNKKSSRKLEFTQPALLGVAGLIVLVALNTNAHSALRRRFISGKNWQLFLDKIPDIVITNSVKNVENYKSITIVPENVVVNLRTRTVL